MNNELLEALTVLEKEKDISKETMLEAIEKEGYDSVATRRVTRKGEPPIRSFFARMFYKLMNKISKTTTANVIGSLQVDN